MTRALALAVLAAAVPARADEAIEPGTSAPEATPNRLNLRLGGATTDSTGRPTLCLDVTIVAKLGIEGCGTGQGVIHDEPGTEMAHFRATWSLVEHVTERGVGRLRAGAGFAELQVGVDHPGFHFGEPDREQGSVAGPEAVVQGQWLVPMGVGVEAIVSFTAGVATFANADRLVLPEQKIQPFASVELGLGW